MDLCPLNDKIPLFLTVSGAFGIVVGLMTILDQICCKKEDDEDGKFLLEDLLLLLVGSGSCVYSSAWRSVGPFTCVGGQWACI